MQTFLKKLIGFSLGPIIGALISFITVPFTTYFILPEEFGKASMFTMVQALASTIVYLGLDQSYSREYHYIDDRKKLFQNAILPPILLAVFSFFTLVVFRGAFSIILFGKANYGYISILFGLSLIMIVFERFILMNIRMQEKALEYSFYSVFLKLSILLFTLILIAMGGRSFLTIVYSNLIGQILGDFYLVIRYRKLLHFKCNNIDYPLIMKIFRFGFPLLIASSVTSFLNTLGAFFIRAYSDFYNLGIYTAGQKIASLLTLIQVSFASFWVPTAYRWHKEKKDMKYFQIVSEGLLLVLTIFFFLLIFLKHYIVKILSSNYMESNKIMGLLALVPILFTISETTTLGISFERKSHLNIYVSIISLSVATVANFMLVPSLGSIGSAIGIASAYLIFFYLRTFFSKRHFFPIKVKIHIFETMIMFVCAVLNAFNLPFLNLYNVLLFIICLVSQKAIFGTIIEIRKKSTEWDFN